MYLGTTENFTIFNTFFKSQKIVHIHHIDLNRKMSKLISYNNLTMVACSLFFYFLHNIFLLNLLVHNSQRIKSKDFYYTVINVFWQIYVYTHITITPIKMWNVFITPKIPHASFQAISCTLNPSSHWSDFYYHSLVLTILKLQINEII